MSKYAVGLLALVASGIVVLVNDADRWSWGYVSISLLVGAVGVIASYLAGQRAGVRAGRRDAYGGFVLLSLGIAILAAGLRSWWVVVAFAAYVALASIALPSALLALLRQPAGPACESFASSCGAAACASCPLGAHQSQARVSNT
jgi:hypothetical protein